MSTMTYLLDAFAEIDFYNASKPIEKLEAAAALPDALCLLPIFRLQ